LGHETIVAVSPGAFTDGVSVLAVSFIRNEYEEQKR
jgi:hypothetical protein